MRVTVGGPVDAADTELAVSVYRRLTSRSAFALSLTDRIEGSPISAPAAAPLVTLPPDPGGAVQIGLPVQDPALPVDPARLRLREPGVYPVRVELRRTGGGPVLARLVTHLVYATPPAEGGEKLRVGLVVPLHAAPALRPDGRRALADGDRARLRGVATSIARRTDVPVTVRPTPETLQALAASDDEADRNAVATLREGASRLQVTAGTYVPVDVSAFAAEELVDELAAQLQRGNQVVSDVLGVQPDPRLRITESRLDDGVLQRLREQQVERLVVPDTALAPVDLPLTLTQPFEIDNRQVRRPAALAADAGLRAHFEPSPDPVLSAHHLLADLAVLYYDRPGRTPRGAVAMPPVSWHGDVAFLGTVLDGLANSPIVSPATVDAIFDTVPPATAGRSNDVLRRSPARPTTGADSLPAERIRTTRARIQSFAAMLDSDNPRDDAMEEQLLVAQSSEVRGRTRTAYLEGVADRIDAELGRVRVPQDRTITLTARRGEIPITVLNEADYPVRLVVQVTSDKLTFPQGSARRVELARRNTTERFSVEARTSGAFPLRVQLVSPDGALLIGETRFTVRSTAISGVGLVLSAGAAGVLLFWWARHFARGRRNRRLVSTT